MRRGSSIVPVVPVCFLMILAAVSVFAQKNSGTTEGSLHVTAPDGSDAGLCPLKRTEVKADIVGSVTRVTVTQIFQNPLNQNIEAVYTFPLSNDAAVDDMTIEFAERKIKGQVMERVAAKQTYEKAKSEGRVAALLEQQRPNMFTQSIANITAGAEIKVVISYVETLRYVDDGYEFRFPMTIKDRYLPGSVDPEEAQRISPKSKVRPGHTISLEIDVQAGVPITALGSSTHEVVSQQFSADNHRVTLKDNEVIPNRDFSLKYQTAGHKIEDAVLAHSGERGGYFTLILQPPDRIMPEDTMPKEIVFVLDTSGSMDGFPIKKAKEAMRLTLDNLNPGDTFNVITFAGETDILFDAPVSVTKDNLERAKDFIDSKGSDGGTEMMAAIKAALGPSDSQDHVRIVCFMTDGAVGNDAEIINEVRMHPKARVFAFGIGDGVNHHLLDEISRVGRGEVEYVSRGDDGSAAARRFYERIRNPLLTDITAEFKGLDVSDTLPNHIPDLFDARPIVIFGRYQQGGSGMIVIKGKMRGQDFTREIPVTLPRNGANNDPIATIWARRKIGELMRGDGAATREAAIATITSLGLEYRLVTPFTSFIAVSEDRVTGEDARRVEVPSAAPDNATFVENFWARRDPPPATTTSVGTRPIAGASGCGVCAEVTVVASSDIDSTSATIQSTVTSETIESLPAKGRSIGSLFMLAPGTTEAPGSGGDIKGLVSSSGQPSTSNQFTVDGIDANLGIASDDASLHDAVGGLPQLTASGGTNSLAALESIAEVSVQTFPSAEDGRVSGTTINVSTRSGTNTYRGSVFHTFGNGVLNASDPFSGGNDRDNGRLNHFGGSIGGPILKNRVFFFGTYEGLRMRQALFGISEVPSFESRLAAPGDLRDILNALPSPNGPVTTNGFAKFSASYTVPAANDIFSSRVDLSPNHKLLIAARFNIADSGAFIRGGQMLGLNTVQNYDQRSGSISVWGSYTPTSSLILRSHGAFSSNDIRRQLRADTFGGASIPSSWGSDEFGLRFLSFGGRSAIANGDPHKTKLSSFQAGFELSTIRSIHTISAGLNLRRIGFDIEPISTEHNVFLNGVGADGTAARTGNYSRLPINDRSIANFSAFVQDEVRINRRVSLTLGLRWERDLAPDGPAVQTSVFPDAVSKIHGGLGNFAPRAGVALDLFGNSRSVLRFGAGLFYDFGNLAAGELLANSSPLFIGLVSSSVRFDTPPSEPLTTLTLFDRDLKTPRTWQLFSEYQQELPDNFVVSASFIALFSNDRYLSRTLFETDPQFDVIRLTDNSARSNYQALNFWISRRFSRGLSLNARYTLARAEDNYSPDTIRHGYFVSSDLENERGPSDLDARHTFAARGMYFIPQFIKDGWIGRASRDWSLSANVYTRSAFPLNVVYSEVTPLGVQLFRPDLVSGTAVYNTIEDTRVINPAAFSIPADGVQGSLRRNSLRGTSLFQLDASLERRFPLASEASLNLSITAHNLLNNVSYKSPERSLGTRLPDGSFVPNYFFGRSIGSYGGQGFTPFYFYGGPRALQLRARLVF